jgi:hypothetical protein
MASRITRASYAILIVAFPIGKLPNHFVQAADRVAIRITAVKSDALPGMKLMNYDGSPSGGYMQHSDPIMAARAAQPMMMNDSLAAIIEHRRRDRRWSVANWTASAAGMVVVSGKGRYSGS